MGTSLRLVCLLGISVFLSCHFEKPEKRVKHGYQVLHDFPVKAETLYEQADSLTFTGDICRTNLKSNAGPLHCLPTKRKKLKLRAYFPDEHTEVTNSLSVTKNGKLLSYSLEVDALSGADDQVFILEVAEREGIFSQKMTRVEIPVLVQGTSNERSYRQEALFDGMLLSTEINQGVLFEQQELNMYIRAENQRKKGNSKQYLLSLNGELLDSSNSFSPGDILEGSFSLAPPLPMEDLSFELKLLENPNGKPQGKTHTIGALTTSPVVLEDQSDDDPVVAFELVSLSPDENILLPDLAVAISGEVNLELSEILANGEVLSIGGDGKTFSGELEFNDDGEKEIILFAKSVEGDELEHSLLLSLDATPPEIVVLSDSSSTNQSSYTLEAQVNDLNLQQTEIFLNNQLLMSSSDAFISTSFDLQEGDNSIVIESIDTVGNTSEKTLSILLDTTPPNLLSFNLEDGDILNQNEINLTGSSDKALSQVSVNGDIATLAGENSFEFIYTATEGSNQLELVLTDTLGNQSFESISFTVDTIAPELISLNIDDGDFFNSPAVSFIGSADKELANVLINGGAASTIEGSNFEHLVTAEEGVNEVEIVLVDIAGNENSYQGVFHVDTIAPVINLLSDIPDEVEQSSFSLDVQIIDENLMQTQVSLNGDEIYSSSSDEFSVELNLNEGENYLNISAADLAGNQTSEQIVVSYIPEEDDDLPPELIEDVFFAFSLDYENHHLVLEYRTPGDVSSATYTLTRPDGEQSGIEFDDPVFSEKKHFTLTATGEYHAQLDVVWTDGREGSAQRTINIPSEEELNYLEVNFVAHPSAPKEILFDLRDSFSSLYPSHFLDAMIDFGDGNEQYLGEERFVFYNYDNEGDYDVTVVLVDPDGNEQSLTKQISVTSEEVPPLFPIANIIQINPDFAPSLYLLEDQSVTPNGEFVSNRWDFGDGTIVENQRDVIHFFPEGESILNYTVTDEMNQSATLERKIVVPEGAGDDDIFIAMLECEQIWDRGVHCRLLMADSQGDISHFSLDWGDGTSWHSSELNSAFWHIEEAEHGYENVGNYEVTLTLFSNSGEEFVASELINLGAFNPGIVADIECDVNVRMVRCDSYGSVISDYENIETYIWIMGDGSYYQGDELREVEHLYDEAGTYEVELIIGDKDQNEFFASHSVNTLSEDDFFDIDIDFSWAGNSTYLLEATAFTGDFVNYDWHLEDYTIEGTDSSVYALVDTDKNETIDFIATDRDGFVYEASFVIPSREQELISFAYTINSEGDYVFEPTIENQDSSTGYSYSWLLDGETIATEEVSSLELTVGENIVELVVNTDLNERLRYAETIEVEGIDFSFDIVRPYEEIIVDMSLPANSIVENVFVDDEAIEFRTNSKNSSILFSVPDLERGSYELTIQTTNDDFNHDLKVSPSNRFNDHVTNFNAIDNLFSRDLSFMDMFGEDKRNELEIIVQQEAQKWESLKEEDILSARTISHYYSANFVEGELFTACRFDEKNGSGVVATLMDAIFPSAHAFNYRAYIYCLEQILEVFDIFIDDTASSDNVSGLVGSFHVTQELEELLGDNVDILFLIKFLEYFELWYFCIETLQEMEIPYDLNNPSVANDPVHLDVNDGDNFYVGDEITLEFEHLVQMVAHDKDYDAPVLRAISTRLNSILELSENFMISEVWDAVFDDVERTKNISSGNLSIAYISNSNVKAYIGNKRFYNGKVLRLRPKKVILGRIDNLKILMRYDIPELNYTKFFFFPTINLIHGCGGGQSVALHENSNGEMGGAVSSTANVADSVFLESNSIVCDDASVYGDVHVQNSIIRGEAVVGADSETPSEYFRVHNSIVTENSTIAGCDGIVNESYLEGFSNIEGTVDIRNITLRQAAEITNSCLPYSDFANQNNPDPMGIPWSFFIYGLDLSGSVKVQNSGVRYDVDSLNHPVDFSSRPLITGNGEINRSSLDVGSSIGDGAPIISGSFLIDDTHFNIDPHGKINIESHDPVRRNIFRNTTTVRATKWSEMIFSGVIVDSSFLSAGSRYLDLSSPGFVNINETRLNNVTISRGVLSQEEFGRSERVSVSDSELRNTNIHAENIGIQDSQFYDSTHNSKRVPASYYSTTLSDSSIYDTSLDLRSSSISYSTIRDSYFEPVSRLGVANSRIDGSSFLNSYGHVLHGCLISNSTLDNTSCRSQGVNYWARIYESHLVDSSVNHQATILDSYGLSSIFEGNAHASHSSVTSSFMSGSASVQGSNILGSMLFNSASVSNSSVNFSRVYGNASVSSSTINFSRIYGDAAIWDETKTSRTCDGVDDHEEDDPCHSDYDSGGGNGSGGDDDDNGDNGDGDGDNGDGGDNGGDGDDGDNGGGSDDGENGGESDEVPELPEAELAKKCEGEGALDQMVCSEESKERFESNNSCVAGSVIDVENQSLGMHVLLGGVPFNLYYESKRSFAYNDRALNIPLTSEHINGIEEVRLNVSILDRVFSETFVPEENMTHTFVWDGEDAEGDLFPYSTVVDVSIEYIDSNGIEIDSYDYSTLIGGVKTLSRPFGGWSIGEVARWDISRGIVWRGDGPTENIVSYFEQEDKYFVYTESMSTIYVFNDNRQHIESIDLMSGRVLYRFIYDSDKRLVAISGSDSQLIHLNYNSDGYVHSISSPNGVSTYFSYDEYGHLDFVQGASSYYANLDHNEEGLLIAYTNSLHGSYEFEYDEKGRLLKDINPLGGEIGLRKFSQDEGFVTEYSENDSLFAFYFNNGGADFSEQLIVHKDQARSYVQSVYGSSQSEVTREAVEVESNFLNEQLTSTTYLGGVERTKLYPSGLEFVMKEEKLTEIDPDDFGRIVSQEITRDVNNRVYSTIFDNNVLTSTSPRGVVNQTHYNEKGEVELVDRAGSLPISYEYNNHGKRVSSIQGDRIEEIEYDENGHIRMVHSPEEHISRYLYDEKGDLLREENADGEVFVYSYNSIGKLEGLVNSKGALSALGYNFLGDLTEVTFETSTDGDLTYTYEYDSMGKVTIIEDPDERVKSYSYDSETGQLIKISSTHADYDFTYNENGQNLSVARDGVEEVYSYDGDLIIEVENSGLIASLYHLDYNADLLPKEWGLSVAHQTLFFESEYDDDLNLVHNGGVNYSYNSLNGFLENWALEGVESSISYNNFGEMEYLSTEFGQNQLLTLELSYDREGRVVEKIESSTGVSDDIYNYSYTPSGQLESVALNGVVIENYEYDSVGNRIVENSEYGEDGRILSFKDLSFENNLSGDVIGIIDTESEQRMDFEYDNFGNLLGVELFDGSIIEYVVDGKNRRVGKIKDGVLEYGLIYKDELNPVGMTDSEGELDAVFIYGSMSHVPDGMIRGAREYKFITDHLGSVRMVVDVENGDIIQEMRYTAFGEVIHDTNPGFQPFGFAGGLYDPDTGLVRFGARDYSPEIGRWMTKDPILFDGGDHNLYRYVNNDPVNFIDPAGERRRSLKERIRDAFDFSDFLRDFRRSATCKLNPNLCDQDDRDKFPVDKDKMDDLERGLDKRSRKDDGSFQCTF